MGASPPARRFPVVTLALIAVVLLTALAQNGAVQISSILAGLAVLGIIGEPVFGPLRWLVIWGVTGLGGQAVGLAWQPVGAGSSVAVAGLLGAVATWVLLPRTAMPLFARAGPALVFAGAAVLCLLRDIHGPPVFVGAGLALAVLLGRRAQRTG